MDGLTVFENLAEVITYLFIKHSENNYYFVMGYWEHRDKLILFICDSQSLDT